MTNGLLLDVDETCTKSDNSPLTIQFTVKPLLQCEIYLHTHTNPFSLMYACANDVMSLHRARGHKPCLSKLLFHAKLKSRIKLLIAEYNFLFNILAFLYRKKYRCEQERNSFGCDVNFK